MIGIERIKITGKKFFVRTDFDVPMVNNKIIDDFRIRKSFKTINHILNNGGSVILASHAKDTLSPVYEYLKKTYDIIFIEEYYPNNSDKVNDALNSKRMILLENLRKYPGEKQNDDNFSRHLSSFADVYVNEAFAVSHRSHSSIVGIPKYLPSFAGFTFEEEVRELSKALKPPHPFFLVLGGAKFETKIPLLKKFFNMADNVFIGGALANDFFHAKGFNTGKSTLSASNITLSEFSEPKLILPKDVVAQRENKTLIKNPTDLSSDETIVDVGPGTIVDLREYINKAKFILWNGPLGNYERGFSKATLDLAELISTTKATTIVGGGDTTASIVESNLIDKFTFVSTGGGAMLDFLSNETLPGIEALNEN